VVVTARIRNEDAWMKRIHATDGYNVYWSAFDAHGVEKAIHVQLKAGKYRFNSSGLDASSLFYHGPAFDTLEEAVAYITMIEAAGARLCATEPFEETL
jgi:hypothetical protein